MTGAAARGVRSMTVALRRVLVGSTSASFGSSRRAEACSLFCRLPYDHDLRVWVHRLPHAKMQGDLESCLTRVRRVIPAYFDHPPCDWPRLETRALKVRAQVLGELGFLDGDQQSAAAFWCQEEQRGGCRAPPHRARQADYRRRCRVHSSLVRWFIERVHITPPGEARAFRLDLPFSLRRDVGAAANVSSAIEPVVGEP